jgi:hypothetical protein
MFILKATQDKPERLHSLDIPENLITQGQKKG